MAFGFLKRNKKNPWEGNYPIPDINEREDDIEFLKDTMKNDSNLHRRTLAFFLLVSKKPTPEEVAKEMGALFVDLKISEKDEELILNDFDDLIEYFESEQ